MASVDLTAVGIANPVAIDGSVSIAAANPGTPILFLLQEHHATLATIQENIDNAQELINTANVDLIGAESHSADEDIDQLTRINNQPAFADHFSQQATRIVGIEYRDVFNHLDQDTSTDAWGGVTVRTHPLNIVRSFAFVGSLFRTRNFDALTGNIILNAGGEHVSHIASAPQTVMNIAHTQLSIVCIRPPSYP